jgi:rod shape-determining protein MreC
MSVMNSAGLVGKITNVFPETSIVMLVTDPQYHTQVKVVGQVVPTPTTVPDTVPSGLAVDDVTTTTSATTTTTTTTTLPDDTPATTVVTDIDGNLVVITVPPEPTPTNTAPDSETANGTTTSTSTTTTTLAPIDVTRETGVIDGFGAGQLPRVRFIADSSQFGRIEIGDAVLTSGGSDSLAPPDIPIGRVANIIENPGTAGLELEVELNADLDRLNFLTVLLYQPPIQAPGAG